MAYAPAALEDTDDAAAREASGPGRAAGAGTTVAGAVSGPFAGWSARWRTASHWLRSSRARTIRHSAARATIVARFGIRITRGAPERSLRTAIPCSDRRGKSVISRAAIVSLSEGVAELLGKAEISTAKARAAAPPGAERAWRPPSRGRYPGERGPIAPSEACRPDLLEPPHTGIGQSGTRGRKSRSRASFQSPHDSVACPTLPRDSAGKGHGREVCSLTGPPPPVGAVARVASWHYGAGRNDDMGPSGGPLWRHASRRLPSAWQTSLNKEEAAQITKQYRFGPILYLGAFVLSFASERWSGV